MFPYYPPPTIFWHLGTYYQPEHLREVARVTNVSLLDVQKILPSLNRAASTYALSYVSWRSPSPGELARTLGSLKKTWDWHPAFSLGYCGKTNRPARRSIRPSRRVEGDLPAFG